MAPDDADCEGDGVAVLFAVLVESKRRRLKVANEDPSLQEVAGEREAWIWSRRRRGSLDLQQRIRAAALEQSSIVPAKQQFLRLIGR